METSEKIKEAKREVLSSLERGGCDTKEEGDSVVEKHNASREKRKYARKRNYIVLIKKMHLEYLRNILQWWEI